jgi:hypothetical protein
MEGPKQVSRFAACMGKKENRCRSITLSRVLLLLEFASSGAAHNCKIAKPQNQQQQGRRRGLSVDIEIFEYIYLLDRNSFSIHGESTDVMLCILPFRYRLTSIVLAINTLNKSWSFGFDSQYIYTVCVVRRVSCEPPQNRNALSPATNSNSNSQGVLQFARAQIPSQSI